VPQQGLDPSGDSWLNPAVSQPCQVGPAASTCTLRRVEAELIERWPEKAQEYSHHELLCSVFLVLISAVSTLWENGYEYEADCTHVLHFGMFPSS
jgi:hypothetical protein